MTAALSALGLEVKYLDRARSFYESTLGRVPTRRTDSRVEYPVGDTCLRLRRGKTTPRGGLHVHYAFEAPAEDYEGWKRRLAALDPEEVSFGSYRSLYVDDPDDHCVEIGGKNRTDAAEDTDEPANTGGTELRLTGIFEVVLEVTDLGRSEGFYQTLGFEAVDRGEDRRRVRLRGPSGPREPFDLELWEPQLGLADARGGVHVELGIRVEDPVGRANELVELGNCHETNPGPSSTSVVDPDGHRLRLHPT